MKHADVLFAVLLLLLHSVSLAIAGSDPHITPKPIGPFHTEARSIIDAQGNAFLVRGTEMPMLTLKDEEFFGNSKDFGPFSPSSLVTIRQRLNMNAIRLPVNTKLYVDSSAYQKRVEQVVQAANQFELLVILVPGTEDSLLFWTQCATKFRSYPNVFFAPIGQNTQELVDSIRSAGAKQPVVVPSPVRDANSILQITPHYTAMRTEAERWQQLGSLATHLPILVNDFDPQLDQKSDECMVFPSDPTEATRLVEDTLAFLDAHQISWTLSSFRPGKLLSDYQLYYWSRLDDGWTCGESPSRGGIGTILMSHLWSGEPLGLFSVDPPTGGILLARGELSTVYGPILADKEITAIRRPLPFQLGNISVHVTDSRGIVRQARMLYTGAGWANLTFAVPADTALGPAEVALVRTDGSVSKTHVMIANSVPGFWTATGDGRGPVIGFVSQRFASGKYTTSPAWECTKQPSGCRTIPIALSNNVVTTVRLDAHGIRYANHNAVLHVTVGNIPVQVLSFGAGYDIGRDQVTIRLPGHLPLAGEVDLMMTVDGVLSNVVRINIAGGAVTPKGFPPLRMPADNPITPAKALLGRYLFYDKRISVNGTTSCATCHQQDKAFTDGRALAMGATGQLHARSALSLVNIAYNHALNWGNPGVHSLEEQALKPMFSSDPVELGVVKTDLLRLIRSDPIYSRLFLQAFPGQTNAFTIGNVAKAIATFERTIISAGSAYDRYHLLGDTTAISESAKRGELLFFLDGRGPSCFRCHSGPNFSDATQNLPVPFHNTGLYNVAGQFSYPTSNLGVYEYTKHMTDVGKFKTPTLRNIAQTAPYMHDGSVLTLEEVMDHYAAGGRTIRDGPWTGSGHNNPVKDQLMHGFFLTSQNRADLISFLLSLTDEGVTTNERFSDPR